MTVVFACFAVSLWASAPAQASGLGYQVVHNYHSGLCMGIQAGSTADDAYVLQGRCNGASDQTWNVEFLGGAAGWMYQNRKSGRCLGIHGAVIAQGTYMIQHVCSTQNHAERFWLTGDNVGGSRNTYTIHYAYNQGWCVGISGGSASAGAHVALGRCSGNHDQEWWNYPG